MFLKVVGSIDQMELDDPDNSDKNSGSIPDSKSVVRSFDAEKSKGQTQIICRISSLRIPPGSYGGQIIDYIDGV